MDDNSALYALLIGIDNYASPHIMSLSGCVNDVEAMNQLLQDRYKIPSENIKQLTNQQATHQAIKAAFNDHLIARANAWADDRKATPPPAFLFHYSGHGSQTIDETGNEPDGMNETIVPHDSRVGNVYDIKDWELKQLIDELTAPFDAEIANVTIILDCCHSGSGTRDIKPTLIPTRRCQPDLRPQQPMRQPNGNLTTRRNLSKSSSWKLGTKYVLLASCRDHEEANEYVVFQGKENYRQHGVLTYFIIEELNRMSSDHRLTYRDLHERVRYHVNSRYENQMPQCEGEKDREIFGGLKPVESLLLTVIDKRGLIWVNGGAAHGLREGSQLYVYPPGTTSLEGAGTPKTILYVEEVGAVKSGCLIESGESEVDLYSRVSIAHIDYSQFQQRVVLDIMDETLRQEVIALLSADRVKPYISFLTTNCPSDLRVQQIDDRLELQDGTGKPLVAPFPINKRHELPSDIQHIARYYNALRVANHSGDLAGTIKVSLKRLLLEAGQIQSADIPLNDEGELELITEERVVVEITNHGDQPMYIAAFNFTHDWSINQLYPRVAGGNEALWPGRTISLGLSAKRKDQLMPSLSEGVNEAREFIKVIATVDETDFDLLQMYPLKTVGTTRNIALTNKHSPLTTLLEQAAQGHGKRALGAPPNTVEDEWTTTDLQFRLVRALDDKKISCPLQGGVRTSLRTYALDLEPPMGFQGQARVLTDRQNTRSTHNKFSNVQLPLVFSVFRQNFASVTIPSKGTRNIDPGGTVIELEVDDTSRATVTQATPLKLYLPQSMISENETMLALAYDGRFFYPVGRLGEGDSLNIEWLPETKLSEETPPYNTRSLGHMIKLYLFKLAGWPEPSMGLHKVRFVPTQKVYEYQSRPDERSCDAIGGEVRYRPLHKGDFQPGQRVALFVHGFASETQWMISSLLPWLEKEDLGYDHYLAFDYETFNTHISANGLTLAKALRAAGFGPDDNLYFDVFAHSMGTQVVRSMVEHNGGEDFVDRCFFAGPPNMGTRLAEAKWLVLWLSTLTLNHAGLTPPTLVASWALKKVSDDAVGADDLRPGSEFYKQLNESDKPAKVPYYIMAGRHDLPTEYDSLWNRVVKPLVGMVDGGLDFLFGDQHDLVINVQSMLKVQNGNYPLALLETQVLPCNHFQYFSHEKGLATLLAWLRPNN